MKEVPYNMAAGKSDLGSSLADVPTLSHVLQIATFPPRGKERVTRQTKCYNVGENGNLERFLRAPTQQQKKEKTVAMGKN